MSRHTPIISAFPRVVLFFLLLSGALSIGSQTLWGVPDQILPVAIQKALATVGVTSLPNSFEEFKILGETFYTLAVTKDDQTRQWTFDVCGIPISVQVIESEIPKPVQDTIQRELTNGASINGVTRSYEAGELIYEVETTVGKQELSVTIQEDGEILYREINRSVLPKKLQQVLSRAAKNETATKFYRSEEGGKSFFTIGFTGNESSRWVTFSADGQIEEEEKVIAIDAVPDLVRQSILKRIAPPNPIRVIQRKSEGEVDYEIWAFPSGKLDIFSVASDGTVEDLLP